MIPVIFMTERQRWPRPEQERRAAQEQAVKDANKEAAAVLGFLAAIGAYGGFFIPKSYGTSHRADRQPRRRAVLPSSPVLRDLRRERHLVVLQHVKNAEMPC
jgi:nitrate/nitrite transporter NarK